MSEERDVLSAEEVAEQCGVVYRANVEAHVCDAVDALTRSHEALRVCLEETREALRREKRASDVESEMLSLARSWRARAESAEAEIKKPTWPTGRYVHIAGPLENVGQFCSRCGQTIQKVEVFGDLTRDDFPGYTVDEEVIVDWEPPYRRAWLARLRPEETRPPDCQAKEATWE